MGPIGAVVELTMESEVAVITVNSPPVNALSASVRNGLDTALRAAIADTEAKAIVLICAGKTFIAGADIREFDSAHTGVSLFDVMERLENAPKPVVAALHGTALGGGLEVALCCHFRLAVPSARCGFPEVQLGIVPGAGGTQRLPRLIGPRRALEMMTFGRHVPADECEAIGLVDALAGEDHLRAQAIDFACRAIAENRPLVKVRDHAASGGEPGELLELCARFRRANADRFRGLLAPEYVIRCVEAAVSLPFDEGMKVERRLSEELMAGEQSAALRHLFFAERRASKLPELLSADAPPSIERVGVYGCGAIGIALTVDLLAAGFWVTLVDGTPALEHARVRVRERYAAATAGAPGGVDSDERMRRLTCSALLSSLGDSDFVVHTAESGPERPSTLASLVNLAKSKAIVATHDCGRASRTLAAPTARAEAVVTVCLGGLAADGRLWEVASSESASARALATVMQLARQIGKVPVLVAADAGPVSERLRSALRREVERLVSEGVAARGIARVLGDFGFADWAWAADRKAAASAPRARGVRSELDNREILTNCLYSVIDESMSLLEEGCVRSASDVDVIAVHGCGWPAHRGGPLYYGQKLGFERLRDRLAAVASRADKAIPQPLRKP